MTKNKSGDVKFSDEQLQLIKTVYIQENMEQFDSVLKIDTKNEQDKDMRGIYLEGTEERAEALVDRISKAAIAYDAISGLCNESKYKKNG